MAAVKSEESGKGKIRGIIMNDALWNDILAEGDRRGLHGASNIIRMLLIERLEALKKSNDRI